MEKSPMFHQPDMKKTENCHDNRRIRWCDALVIFF